MQRAAEILLSHSNGTYEFEWAREMVVAELAPTDPALAAALMFQEAEMHLSEGIRDVYVASANRLAEARDLLSGDEHVPIWKERIAEFRAKHHHLAELVALLDERGM